MIILISIKLDSELHTFNAPKRGNGIGAQRLPNDGCGFELYVMYYF